MSVPANAKAVTVTVKGNKFRKVTEVRSVPIPKPGKGELIVKYKYVGINASDILMTSGGYDPTTVPPFTAGLEGIGEVVAVGEGVSLKVGQAVVCLKFGSFAEYVTVPAETAVPVDSTDPAYLSIVLSGLTASIAFEEEADLKPGKKVMVTAAAGGTGQFAVQIAKMAGCHVIGTTSTAEKGEFLKKIGCDRVINYKKENVGEVLAKEYPEGLDVVYECIGKDMFDACLANLAIKGRLIVIGAISTNQREDLTDTTSDLARSKLPIAMTVLRKSASVRGFHLLNYRTEHASHIGILTKLYKEKKLTVAVYKGEGAKNGPFKGIEKIVDAIDAMYAGSY